MTQRRVKWDFGRHLRSLAGWRRPAADLRDEMQLHADLRSRDLEARGVLPAEARDRADREAGRTPATLRRVARLAAATDRASAWRQRLDEFWQDARYAVRSMRRSPAFAAVTVLTLAFGLGANAAIFGVVDAAMLRPLPFDPHNTLVRVREYRTLPDGTRFHVDAGRLTAEAVAARRDLFSASLMLSGTSRALAQSGGALRVAATRVGPGFTAILGVSPLIGRTFTADEERAGDGSGVALISHRFWQTHFGGRDSAAGETMLLDGRPFAIVGVLPPRFHVPFDSDIWFPAQFADDERSLFIAARLAPGVSLPQAQAALEVVGRQLSEQHPAQLRGLGITAVLARDYFAGDETQVALALLGAVGLLLLIAGTNVALLLTTRFAARRGEVAIRAALGCSHGRQVRQFVTEGLLLFSVACVAGLVLAIWVNDALVVFLPDAIAEQVGMDGIHVNLRMVTFASAIAVVAGVAFGLVAALRTSRAGAAEPLRGDGRSLARASSRGLLGSLAVVEVALALVLLATAGVMIDTVRRLQARDLGFNPSGVATLQLDLNSARYRSADARTQLLDRVLGRVRDMPGVAAAGATSVNPLCCGDWGIRVTPEGTTAVRPDELPVIQHFIVTPGYFEAIRQPLVSGRTFTSADVAGAALVAVIDRAAADRFWPGERAIGKRIKRGIIGSDYPWLTVVGVVQSALEEGDYTESWYIPQAQHAMTPSGERAHLMIRTNAQLSAILPALRAIVNDIDPMLPVHGAATLDALRSDNLEQGRLGAVVAVSFAAAGMLLAGLGLYGVLSFTVSSDRRELGIRLAIGATGAGVLRLVLWRGLRLTVIGLAIGAAAAWGSTVAITRFIEDASVDARVIPAAAAVLLFTALLATLVPARRAARVDPLTALRSE